MLSEIEPEIMKLLSLEQKRKITEFKTGMFLQHSHIPLHDKQSHPKDGKAYRNFHPHRKIGNSKGVYKETEVLERFPKAREPECLRFATPIKALDVERHSWQDVSLAS